MDVSLGTILIYARNMQETAQFYCNHFGFHTSLECVEGLIELIPKHSGTMILIHQAAKSIKLGHAGIKLMFHVPDVKIFVAKSAMSGLAFGPIHQANGYQFANTKDPDGNSISISSRAYREHQSHTA